MTRAVRLSIILLRLAMGALLFYSGLTRVFDSSTSLPQPLVSAFLPELYHWLGDPGRLSMVNAVYEWVMLLVGLLLLLGLMTRLASFLAIILALFSYLPSLPNSPRFALNESLIYILVYILLITSKAGLYLGMDKYVTFSLFHRKHKHP